MSVINLSSVYFNNSAKTEYSAEVLLFFIISVMISLISSLVEGLYFRDFVMKVNRSSCVYSFKVYESNWLEFQYFLPLSMPLSSISS